MNSFDYDKEENTFTCPARETLYTNGSIYMKNNHSVKHYKTKKCKGSQQRVEPLTLSFAKPIYEIANKAMKEVFGINVE